MRILLLLFSARKELKSLFINFNVPPRVGDETKYVLDALSSGKLSGDGPYGVKCQHWLEENTGSPKVLLTPSCTHALEMAAILLDIKPGDEVIMPSYTFVSTANAFALRGAKIVFIDIRPDTMNIDERLVERAITYRTKAIVVVHYAGVACEMRSISSIAERHGIYVVEDAAQGVMSTYEGSPLGTLGHLGAYSFHETKNLTSGGEGGALLINDRELIQRAEVIREKGTNRSQFFRGMVDKYSWVDIGSSYLPSELQAAFLWAQLQNAAEITANRMETWDKYMNAFSGLRENEELELPIVPNNCKHNGHMIFLHCVDVEERSRFIEYKKHREIMAVFHYVPLHSSPAGVRLGRFFGSDLVTTNDSERLVRLPLWYGMSEDVVMRVINATKGFFR